MPRLQKSLLQKKWLRAEDVFKVMEAGPSFLVEIFALDKSNEMKWKFEYKCTFCPKICNAVISRHKHQVCVQLEMLDHIQQHIATLSAASQDEQQQFVTRNNWYKEEMPRKKRKAEKCTESSQAQCSKKLHVEAFAGSSGLSETKKTGAHTRSQISRNGEDKEFPLSDSIDSLKQEDYVSKSALKNGKDELPDNVLLINQVMKNCETAKYKVAKTLLRTLPKEWKDLPKLLDSCIKKVGIAKDIITVKDKEDMLWAMDIYVKSHKKSEEIKHNRSFAPLTKSEEKMIHSVSVEEWAHLGSATDEESERQFKVYVELLEREYFNSPVKLKKCRHCDKTFTATTSLLQHIKSISGKRIWFCWDCLENGKNVSFTRKTSCQYHILNKMGIERYRCGYDGCTSTLDHPHHMKSHIFDHHGWKAYPCKYNECNERFNSKNALKRHMAKCPSKLSNSSGVKPNVSDSGVLVGQSINHQGKGAGIATFLKDQASLETTIVKEKQGDAHTENADMLFDESLEENDHRDRKKDMMDHPTASVSHTRNHSGHSFSDLLKAIEIVERNAASYTNGDSASPNLSLRNELSNSTPQPVPSTSALSLHTTSSVARTMDVLSESRSYSQKQNQTTASGTLDSSYFLSDDINKNQSVFVQMS